MQQAPAKKKKKIKGPEISTNFFWLGITHFFNTKTICPS